MENNKEKTPQAELNVNEVAGGYLLIINPWEHDPLDPRYTGNKYNNY